MTNTPEDKSFQSKLEAELHLVGCAVGNLDPQSDDFVERIEELEEEAKKNVLDLIKTEIIACVDEHTDYQMSHKQGKAKQTKKLEE